VNEFNPYAPPAARVVDVIEARPATPFFAVTIFKLVLMSICTFGIYELYWFYKNWQLIKAREEPDILPFWRAVFAYFFCYQCFVHVRDYEAPQVSPGTLLAGPLAAGWIVMNLLWRLPDAYGMLSLFAFLFIIPVQVHANRINQAVAPGHDPNGGLSWLNWVGIVLGGLFLSLAALGFFAPEAAAAVPERQRAAPYAIYPQAHASSHELSG
jgi:hypothetical protein